MPHFGFVMFIFHVAQTLDDSLCRTEATLTKGQPTEAQRESAFSPKRVSYQWGEPPPLPVRNTEGVTSSDLRLFMS